MKKILVMLMNLAVLAGCNSEAQFSIQGNIEGADDQTLYLKSVELNHTTILDSVTLDKSGDFSFKAKAPLYPEFFTISLKDQALTLAIDSTETITVQAKAKNLLESAQIEGSVESVKMKEIALASKATQTRIDSTMRSKSKTATQDALNIINDHKKSLYTYIFENPRSHAAYFALLQRMYGKPLFSPFDNADYRAFAAVATSWDAFFKDSPRSKHLKNITLAALKEKRGQKDIRDIVNTAKEQNYIEIVLPNLNGKQLKLSDFQGKYILLDFTAYQTEYSPAYNMKLAEIYNKYQKKGLEIFQISLDQDEHFWKVTANNLPWITVRDRNSLSSQYARSYNVTNLPTTFLLNPQGDLILRFSNTQEIEKELDKVL